MVGVGLMYGQNLDKDTPLKEKLEDLFEIVDSNKIGMMTTRTSDGLLVSRAMVTIPCLQRDWLTLGCGGTGERRRPCLYHQYRDWEDDRVGQGTTCQYLVLQWTQCIFLGHN